MSAARNAAAMLAGLLCLACTAATAAEHRGRPGDFDYYALVLSWSPTYCETNGHEHRGAECQSGATHGFVLHGFWPQYDKGWPLNCHIADRPWVPQEVIDEIRPIMPSKGLIIHEYHAHGTCSGLDPADYFAKAQAAFQKIVIPPSLQAPEEPLQSSPAAIEQTFLTANQWLKPDMLAVTCRGQALLDVRICFAKDLTPTACGANEQQNRLCAASAIAVPPVD